MFFKKTISFFIVLSLLLLTSCSLLLQGENKTDDAASGKKNTIDDIPLTSTVPPYSKSFVQPGHEYDVECFIFDYNEALEMYNRLRENGIDFYDNYALFNYQDEEVFTGYKFHGVMTRECALSCQGKEFYELEFEKNKVGLKVNLYYKDKYAESSQMGLYKYPFETVTKTLLSPEWSKEQLNNFDISEAYLSPLQFTDYPGAAPYSRYVMYENRDVIFIVSYIPIPDDFIDKIKDTFIILTV